MDLMGFTPEETLESFFDESYVGDVGKAIVDNQGDRMLAGVKHRTPIADLPEAYKGDLAAFVEDRGGRVPGTLRDKWKRTPVVGTSGSGLRVVVWNGDPVVDHVEWDTRPHKIRAHARPGPHGSYQGSLRFPDGPVFRYAIEVWHPGTTGVHMMRDTEAETEASWEGDAERIIEQYETFYEARYT